MIATEGSEEGGGLRAHTSACGCGRRQQTALAVPKPTSFGSSASWVRKSVPKATSRTAKRAEMPWPSSARHSSVAVDGKSYTASAVSYNKVRSVPDHAHKRTAQKNADHCANRSIRNCRTYSEHIT